MIRNYLMIIFTILIAAKIVRGEGCEEHKTCIECSFEINCEWDKECKEALKAQEELSRVNRILACEKGPKIIENDISFCPNITDNRVPLDVYFEKNRTSHNLSQKYLCIWKVEELNSNRNLKFSLNAKFYSHGDKILMAKLISGNRVKEAKLFPLTSILKYYEVAQAPSAIVVVYFSKISQENSKDYFYLGMEYNSKDYKRMFYIILFSLASIGLVIGVVIFICYKCCRKKDRRNCNNEREMEIYLEKSRAKIKEAITNQEYKALNTSDRGELKCTICFDNVNDGNKIGILHCGHVFHYSCIMKWCEQKLAHPTCPNCNYDILNCEIVNEKHSLSDENHNKSNNDK